MKQAPGRTQAGIPPETHWPGSKAEGGRNKHRKWGGRKAGCQDPRSAQEAPNRQSPAARARQSTAHSVLTEQAQEDLAFTGENAMGVGGVALGAGSGVAGAGAGADAASAFGGSGAGPAWDGDCGGWPVGPGSAWALGWDTGAAAWGATAPAVGWGVSAGLLSCSRGVVGSGEVPRARTGRVVNADCRARPGCFPMREPPCDTG